MEELIAWLPAELASLPREVREHAPPLALDGGIDGLDAYRVIAPAALELLAPGGVVIFEIGQGQESDVTRIMAGIGLETAFAAKPDLNGIPRAVIGRKPFI